MKRKIEVLAPAGSYESLTAAINAGADAVYIGGTKFGARAYADNLSEEQMLQAIDYVHLHGKKIYMTVNTLLKEHELSGQLYDYLLPYYRQGLDAVIVQDVGVLKLVREHFPGLAVHASTQMTITNVSGAKFMERQGVARVVTARELSLPEIKEIAKETELEIESFVHGALCYCYSGQCLYSSLIGGRSGNRGQCAQPCRLPYRLSGETEAEYLLSPKDICTLEILPEILEAGVSSLKIEGRMKKPEYVAGVTAMYRKYTDMYLATGKAGYRVSQEDKEILMDLYNRGGFHTGYYTTRNGPEMIALKRPNHAGVKALQILSGNGTNIKAKALTNLYPRDVIELPSKETFTLGRAAEKGEVFKLPFLKCRLAKGEALYRTRNERLLGDIRESIVNRKRKEKINGILNLSVAESAKLDIVYGDIRVSVTGAVIEEAKNQPVDRERIEKQMRKTGNTEFEFDELQIILSGSVFLPMQSLNELRRTALESLAKEICARFKRSGEVPYIPETAVREELKSGGQKFYVCVETPEQFEAVIEEAVVSRVYIDAGILERLWENPRYEEMISNGKKKGKELFLATPHIFRKDTKEIYHRCYPYLFASGIDGVLLRNMESYEFLKEHGFSGALVLDHNLYQWNREGHAFWKAAGITETTAPLELNHKELAARDITDSELIVYGYLPMMVSAQCVQKTKRGCFGKPGFLTMTDRYRKEFSIKNCCNYCYNVIYNTEPLMLLDQKEEIEALAPKALRLQFTKETKRRTKEILDAYKAALLFGAEYDGDLGGYTRGHFKRGVK